LPADENGKLQNKIGFFVHANGMFKHIEIDRKKFAPFDIAVKELVKEFTYFTRDAITPLACEKLQNFKQKDIIIAFVFFGSELELN
jgi:hypothetical protein